MNKRTQFFVLVGIIVVFALVIFFRLDSNNSAISSFEECVAAGNPVMESYPRQCRTEAGELFVEDISAQIGDQINLVGEITSIDASEVPVDGPYRVDVNVQDRGYTIVIPSMGINQCPVKEDLVDTAELQQDQKVAFSGVLGSNNRVSVCESETGYLQTIANDELMLSPGQTRSIKGLEITLHEVVQESRCPVDAECIEGGAVTVDATFASGTESTRMNVPSDQAPQEIFNKDVSISKIAPPLYSGESIAQERYRITFSVQQVDGQ